jgi:hypothetical protein
MKNPKSKLVEIRIEEKGRRIASFDGSIKATDNGTLFVGTDTDDRVAKIRFPAWNLKKAGQPKRSEQKNMTLILQNHLVMKIEGVSWSLAPGLWNKPVADRTILRAKADAKPNIRFIISIRMEDGKTLAAALINDGIHREKPDTTGGILNSEITGPAWVMFHGDKQAKFVSNFSLNQEPMTNN